MNIVFPKRGLQDSVLEGINFDRSDFLVNQALGKATVSLARKPVAPNGGEAKVLCFVVSKSGDDKIKVGNGWVGNVPLSNANTELSFLKYIYLNITFKLSGFQVVGIESVTAETSDTAPTFDMVEDNFIYQMIAVKETNDGVDSIYQPDNGKRCFSVTLVAVQECGIIRNTLSINPINIL